MSNKPHIAIIGAGPGGLMSATLLAAQGYRITILEKSDCIGGRSQKLTLGPYHFDTGPTFFTLPEQFSQLMNWAHVDYHRELKFERLNPLYTLTWPNAAHFSPSANPTKMTQAIANRFPQQLAAYQQFQQREQKKFTVAWNALSQPFPSLFSYLHPTMLRGLSALQIHQSLQQLLSRTFAEPHFEQALGFQAKYLGMRPEACPALFSMLSYLERTYGLYHVQGGLNSVQTFLAEYCQKQGVKIQLNTEVTQIKQRQKHIEGLELADGSLITADAYILNADFAQTIPLLAESARPKYTNAKLAKKTYSLSTINWYFGLDCQLPLTHHHFCLPNQDEATQSLIYLHNPSLIDPTLAPPGHSCLYALMPVENQQIKNYTPSELADFKHQLLTTINQQVGFDIRPHIIYQHEITPAKWQADYSVFAGAVFNLAHTFDQLLYFRPHNQFLSNLFLVGGGTHPGSGLPTIFESARITSNLIFKKFNDHSFIPKTKFLKEEN